MSHYTTRPQWVARLSTVALWAVGSAYLIKSELVSPSPDWVLMTSTPVVWAIVISLPVMATYARRDRQFVATMLIWCAALAGSAYTLQATLGRQAESRDIRVERAHQIEADRARLLKDLTRNQAMLREAQAKCGQGRKCYDSTRATIRVYSQAIAGVEAKLAALQPTTPAAGERRIAALITAMTGHDGRAVAEAVGLALPALFGLVVEISALALAKYGWAPHGAAPQQQTRETRPARRLAAVAQPATVGFIPTARKQHPVIEALSGTDRPVTNAELARLMGVTPGESSKRWQEVSDKLSVQRVGRRLQITLA